MYIDTYVIYNNLTCEIYPFIYHTLNIGLFRIFFSSKKIFTFDYIQILYEIFSSTFSFSPNLFRLHRLELSKT